MAELSLRQKSVLDLIRRVKPLKGTIKQWFFHEGMKFLQANQLTEEEELFLEKVTDFYIEDLERLEEDIKFIEKVDLGPIQLTKKKNKEDIKI